VLSLDSRQSEEMLLLVRSKFVLLSDPKERSRSTSSLLLLGERSARGCIVLVIWSQVLVVVLKTTIQPI
jgi:hypothetical protein